MLDPFKLCARLLRPKSSPKLSALWSWKELACDWQDHISGELRYQSHLDLLLMTAKRVSGVGGAQYQPAAAGRHHDFALLDLCCLCQHWPGPALQVSSPIGLFITFPNP